MMQAFGVIAGQAESPAFKKEQRIELGTAGGFQTSAGMKFKVPSLRNVAITGPYFHDGSAATLAQAIRVMGIQQLGRELTGTEVIELAAFLHTLTGRYQGMQL